jgi:hypothetical protein
MIDDPSFMPVLVAGDRELGDRHLHRRLLPGVAAAADLVIGFAARSSGAEGRKWLTVDDAVKRRLSVEGAEHIARQHLLTRENRPGWLTVRSVAGSWLERRGDDHVAADLIDTDLMLDAHRLLGADELVIAVPTPGAMIAGPATAGALIAALAAMTASEAKRANRTVLSTAVLRVRAGEVVGMAAAVSAAAAPGRVVEPTVEPADDLPQPDARDGSAVFNLSCMTVEEVEQIAKRCLDRYVSRLVKQDWFKGVIVMSVNGYMLPGTDANRVALQELAEKLDESTSWKQLTTRGGKSVAIRVRLDA